MVESSCGASQTKDAWTKTVLGIVLTMTYRAPFLRLVLSGTLATTEGWSTTLNMIRDSAAPLPDVTEVPEAIVTAAKALLANGLTANHVTLDLVKLNVIGVDGRYLSRDESIFREVVPPGRGTSSIPSSTNRRAVRGSTLRSSVMR